MNFYFKSSPKEFTPPDKSLCILQYSRVFKLLLMTTFPHLITFLEQKGGTTTVMEYPSVWATGYSYEMYVGSYSIISAWTL